MERLTKQQKWVCGIVLSLGVISAVLGLSAEMTRVKASQIGFGGQAGQFTECDYPSSPAFLLGVFAALVLLVAQVLVTVVGGCICCRPPPPMLPNAQASSNRSVAIICLVACWITFLNAFSLLMAGAGASLNDIKHQSLWYDGQCNVVKPLVFAGGALLALATVVLDLIFYLASCAAKASAASAQVSPNQIALGQPYYGPPNGNGQAYSYPFVPYPHPAHNQVQVSTYPNVPPHPPLGYPTVVPGFPKPSAPSQEV